jgi:hypothetical protein
MTRLELLHTIQENAELLTLRDAVSLMAGRFPENAEAIAAWDQMINALITSKDL